MIQEVVEATQKVLDLIRSFSHIRPDRKEKVTYETTPYFDVHDTLRHEGGVIIKGHRIVIPMALRCEMKRRLHAAHMDYDSLMARARDTNLLWPLENIKRGETTTYGGEMCQQAKPKQQNEPLTSHDGGNGPRRKVGVDLFELMEWITC